MNVQPRSFGRRAAENPAIVELREAPVPVAELDQAPVEIGLPSALQVSIPAGPPLLTRPPSSPKQALLELRALCLRRVDPVTVANVPPERLRGEMERLVSELATSHRIQLNGREQRQLAEELVDDMLGLGPLQPLLADDSIADIMVNGPDKVFVERNGKVTLTDVRFRDAAHVTNICQRIASGVGRRVDESSPTVDARLKDGSRVNIVLQPLALDGPYISIRKFGKKAIDFARLISYGALTSPVARVLEIAGRARLNIVISGGTGSGKTTMMNAISRTIDAGERVVTIEDAAELQLQQPHVVRLETRPASLEGRGEITQRDLVRNALRMRPDRVIIGEVRGGEAFDMLQAMNTGHDGSLTTVHANSPRDALARIENMVLMAVELPINAIREQIASGINLIVHLSRLQDGTRRVTHVTEIVGMQGGIISMHDIFEFQGRGVDAQGLILGQLQPTGLRPHLLDRLGQFGEHAPIEWFLRASHNGVDS